MDHTAGRRGFTIIEVIVVAAIIGAIMTFMLTRMQSSQITARDNKRIADVKSMIDAVNLYADRTGSYPQCGCAFPAAPCCAEDSSAWGADFESQVIDFIKLSEIRDPQPDLYSYQYQSDAANGCVITYFSERSNGGVSVNCK